MRPLLLLLTIVAISVHAADEKSLTVRVMSFNVRYGTAKDGPDHWDKRKDLFLETIRKYDPDLLGMQEVLAMQADFLQENLSGYGFAGTGRDDGKRGGEYSPIMFKKSRFDLLDSGQYWLSPTPEVVASKGWDAALPRIVTWVRLKEKPTGTAILVFNTHWDHVGNVARVESAKLMRRLMEQKRGDAKEPVVVTGDFNSEETTPQYKRLTAGDGQGVQLIDAYREVHPQRQRDEASFHEFKGTREGLRIDWILHSPQWKATGAGIDHAARDGHYPSDHFPVTAELELK
jgi:endonuclease/exonuclease/phosphatase family metal-dependent hydrolase